MDHLVKASLSTENPTPIELQKAKETVDSFHSLDLVIVDQSNHGKIIVIIEFTPLDQLSKSNKKTLTFWNFKILGRKNVGRGLAGAIFTKAMLSTSSTIWMCFKHPRPNVSKSCWHSFGITSPPNSFLTKLICSISSVPTGQSRAEALKVHWVYSIKWIWLLKPFLKESTAAWIIEAPYTVRKLIKHSKDTLTSGFLPLRILTIKADHEKFDLCGLGKWLQITSMNGQYGLQPRGVLNSSGSSYFCQHFTAIL
ncbi:hypothetical protein VP01_3142g2 [Puccinia sorghi]|uniref:Uncharacterized protein n=1 Tax=Puccinia sorghi TaxID=27349 RepID=A0A0L6V0T7_9BASI|nr:hypothetical protein VP01_3142g2 [Puccinia sorghi]